MTDQADVIEQMAAEGLSGLSPGDLIIDGQIQRFRPDWEPKIKKERAWYVLFEFVTDSGERLISGAFGWFKGDDRYSFNVSVNPKQRISDAERERLRREQEEKRRLAEQEKKKEAQKAAKRAAEIWNKCPDSGQSPYLQRKKVKAFGLHFSRGSIVVPVTDLDGSIWGLQFIDPDGNKKFLTGTSKKGRFHSFGSFSNPEFIAIAEGYATAASIHMATGWPAVVAFDAGNLLPVAERFRAKFPNARIVVCGDDDAGGERNTGRERAEDAAAAVSGMAVFPPPIKDVA